MIDGPTRRWWAAPSGGLAVAASMPPWGFWPLAIIGVGLLALAPADTRRSRALTSLLFAVCWLAPATAWMTFLTAPGHVAAVVIFAERNLRSMPMIGSSSSPR